MEEPFFYDAEAVLGVPEPQISQNPEVSQLLPIVPYSQMTNTHQYTPVQQPYLQPMAGFGSGLVPD